MYKVIVRFRDLTDGHLYEIGDVFPFDGREISLDRLETLETPRNKAGIVLIVKNTEVVTDTVKAEPSTAPRKARKKA